MQCLKCEQTATHLVEISPGTKRWLCDSCDPRQPKVADGREVELLRARHDTEILEAKLAAEKQARVQAEATAREYRNVAEQTQRINRARDRDLARLMLELSFFRRMAYDLIGLCQGVSDKATVHRMATEKHAEAEKFLEELHAQVMQRIEVEAPGRKARIVDET